MREGTYSHLSILLIGDCGVEITRAVSQAKVVSAHSLEVSIERLRIQRFDLVFVNRTLPDGDGLVLGPVITRSNPQSISILLASELQWASKEAALRLGFTAAYSPMSVEMNLIDDLLQSRGKFIGRTSERRSKGSPLDRLTAAEREILLLIATGATTHEIAHRRHNSIATIKSHLTSIYRKLEVRNRAGAIGVLNRN